MQGKRNSGVGALPSRPTAGDAAPHARGVAPGSAPSAASVGAAASASAASAGAAASASAASARGDEPASSPRERELSRFAAKVLQMGRERYRDLPWRFCDDPYAVLVSEVMLQQTQVPRVLGRWERWLERFPSVDALAAADTAIVVEEWQGLGYNRRALALKRTADICSRDHAGTLPDGYEGLLALPGVGPATAAGVCVFARNVPALYLETNVRSVLIHEFFPDSDDVKDRALVPILKECSSLLFPEDDADVPTAGTGADGEQAGTPRPCDPRTWYYALLDYGAYLKAQLPNPSRRSAHYAKQSAFDGSRRQKRAELLRFVLAVGRCTTREACAHLAEYEREHGRRALDEEEVAAILEDLARDGFFGKEDGRWVL